MTCSYSKEFSSSSFVSIESAFINEYLASSTGEAVKVYLYGLFLCQNPARNGSTEDFANMLGLTEKEVYDNFKYWEEMGLVNILSKEPMTVHYLPVRSAFAVKPRKYKAEKYSEFTKGLQSYFPDRMISTSEYTEYFSVMESLSIKPDAMLIIVKYCIDLKGNSIGYRYIIKVAKDFGNRGLNTVEKIEAELSSYVLRTVEIQRVLQALSIKRQPDIDDANYFKKWTQELHFEPDNVVFAATKLKKGSIQKLDSFLMELYAIKSFSKEEITDFINKRQAVYDLTIKINKALSIYVEVIDTVIDTYTNKWLSFGFNEEALLFVANICFKSGKNTLSDMDELLENLRMRGVIDLSSIGDYFENIKKVDEFIKKLLMTVGINRRPTPWDRENVNIWKSWNFTEEMILEAAKLSSGKSSPIAYMNGILSNWKNNGIFNAEALSELAVTSTDNSQENYNREYERRRSIALSRAQKNNEIAMSIPDFAKAFGRLNGMEKDLAFAELSNNTDALAKLEQEQALLTNKITELLKTKGLSIEDLSPKYACEKCHDTGYIGTHRCDCFGKTV